MGYDAANEIETSTLLDLSEDLEKDNLRFFLHLAAANTSTTENPPRLPLVLKKADGSTLNAEIVATKSKLSGEDVIEIFLITTEDLKLTNRLINLPWKLYISFLCLIVITVFPNVLLPKLNVNNAPSTFLPPEAPSVILNNQIREIFPDDEVFILLFEGVALFSDGFITAYDKLAERLENHSQIDNVISLTKQDHIRGSGDGFLVEPLLDVNDLHNIHPRERKEKILLDRFASKALVATDGSAVAMIIIPEPLDNSILNLKLEEDILHAVTDLQLKGYLQAMAGEITTDVAQMRMVLRDNMLFIPVTVAIGLLLTWTLFHRVIAVIVTGIATGAVVNSTIAFYVIFQQPFNTISGIIPPLLSALTIAALVHFYNALHYASQRGLIGKKRVDAALKEIKKPAFFSALTTSIGLASLGLSPIPPISVFGLTAAAGVALIYVIVIYLLPPIFTHFDNQQWPSRKSGLVLMDQLVTKLFHTGIRYPLPVLAIALGSLLLASSYITRINAETNILEFFPPTHSLHKDINHIEEKLSGTTPMEVVFSSNETEGLIQPKALKEIRAFQNWLEQLQSVDKTLSIGDFIEEMHWGFHEEQPQYRAIPQNPNLITQYLFIYDGEDIYDFIDEEYKTVRVTLNVNIHGANQISALMDDINSYLSERPTPIADWKITGAGRMFADQEDLLIEGQVKSLGGAVSLIFVLMLVLWRSFKDALICMIPNLSPVLLIFIVMGTMNIYLDLATAMIASVAVGIAIDDTIHVYHGFIYRIRKGVTPVIAMARTYRQAGRAVMTTSIILCAQFLTLLASAFTPMTHFGFLASIGLIAALVFDLLLLPALLTLLFKNNTAKSQS